MRKRLVELETGRGEAGADEWLDLEGIAEVEITSEDAAYPVETALVPGAGPGWRAATAGEQVVRIIFDEPQRLRHIQLVFDEPDEPRTQEFVLRWSPGGEPAREIVRQQWNFHPPNATREVEDYRPDLSGVRVLELAIVPDVGGGPARASLSSMRLA